MSAKFPRGGGAGPFLARSLYLMTLYSIQRKILGFLCLISLITILYALKRLLGGLVWLNAILL